jgi:hypothetical protein
LPELASQNEMLRAGTQQCTNKLYETSKKDMRALQNYILGKVEAELNVSAAHVDQQVNRISGQLRQELKNNDEIEAKAKQWSLVIEHQIENQGKVEDDDQLTLATEAIKTKIRPHENSESENEADGIEKVGCNYRTLGTVSHHLQDP